MSCDKCDALNTCLNRLKHWMCCMEDMLHITVIFFYTKKNDFRVVSVCSCDLCSVEKRSVKNRKREYKNRKKSAVMD